MKNSELLNQLEKHNQDLLDFSNKMLELPEELLLARPSEKTWSALECFDHMNKATELYLNQIEKKLTSLKAERNKVYKKTWFAGMFTKQLAPTEEGIIKSKMKTMKVFFPDTDLSLKTIERFKSTLERFEKILAEVKGKDLRSFKVTTALGPILKFHLGDALGFVYAHNLRHAQQIKNTLARLNEDGQVAA